MSTPEVLDDRSLALLLTEARTHSTWLDRPVDDATLRALYELTRWGPTSGNSSPMRVLFVRSAESKALLRPALAPMNVDKTMGAPVTAVIAWDTAFWEQMPKLFPGRDMRGHLLAQPPAMRERLGIQSATLSAGYFLLAARALGLDCGPMAGFDPAKVDAAFFPDGAWRSLLLINLGHGDPGKLCPRLPRLPFEDAARIA